MQVCLIHLSHENMGELLFSDISFCAFREFIHFLNYNLRFCLMELGIFSVVLSTVVLVHDIVVLAEIWDMSQHR